MKKNIAVFFVLSILMAFFTFGCDNASDKNALGKDNNVKAIVETDNEVVSVDRFMEYYGVTETDIPRDYILDFIMEYKLREDTLAKKDYWTSVSNDYQNGVIYGTDTGSIFQGTPSELPIEEYIKNADVINIDFDMYYSGELSYPRRITLDLKNKKIYYATKSLTYYTDADMCADLTDEDVEGIREELPKHLSEKVEKVTEYNLDYTFTIRMKDPEYNTKAYRGNSGDEINYPGFDAYWKELYKKKFGEEFVFDRYEGYE